jgi:hypothetical protein
LVIAEIDFGQLAIWHSLGDFLGGIQRHRPLAKPLVP